MRTAVDLVALENCCSSECGDSDKLSGSPDTSGCGECDCERYPAFESAVLDPAVGIFVLLRIHVCRRREANRRHWNAAGLHGDHDLLVAGLRQSRAGSELWDACGEQVPAGNGRGGGFPAATRAVAEWFPTQERATAMGIINAGTAVGAVIAPPLIAFILGFCELAMDIPDLGSTRSFVDSVVAALIFCSGAADSESE